MVSFLTIDISGALSSTIVEQYNTVDQKESIENDFTSGLFENNSLRYLLINYKFGSY